MNGADPDDSFIEVIGREVEADPGNLALREDFITLLLGQDPDRAATELAAFEALGGAPARVRLLRARLMAARLRTSNPPPPIGAAPPAAAPAPAVRSGGSGPEPVPTPAYGDHRDDSPATSTSLWDGERPAVTAAELLTIERRLREQVVDPRRPVGLDRNPRSPDAEVVDYRQAMSDDE